MLYQLRTVGMDMDNGQMSSLGTPEVCIFSKQLQKFLAYSLDQTSRDNIY